MLNSKIFMNRYIDYGESLRFEGMQIPKNTSNRHYQQFLEEQETGKAVLIPYTPPAPTWDDIRNQRNILLKETDWTDLPNTPLTNKQDWLNYRQALRDLPQAYPDPSQVIWPQKPQ